MWSNSIPFYDNIIWSQISTTIKHHSVRCKSACFKMGGGLEDSDGIHCLLRIKEGIKIGGKRANLGETYTRQKAKASATWKRWSHQVKEKNALHWPVTFRIGPGSKGTWAGQGKCRMWRVDDKRKAQEAGSALPLPRHTPEVWSCISMYVCNHSLTGYLFFSILRKRQQNSRPPASVRRHMCSFKKAPRTVNV